MYIPSNSNLLALGALFSSVSAAAIKGFNYGSSFTDGSPKGLSDFTAEFTTAQQLTGAPGFTSARLFTTIQGGTAQTVISAIPAAINTKTSLLLGVWASQDQAGFNNELAALTTAIQQFGTQLAPLCVGISVGSEDLYRNSPIGIINMSGIGQNPNVIVNYISQVRNAIKGTALAGCPVGHVDTWTGWVNGSNAAVIAASDFLGTDAYPYFQDTEYNDISVGYELFFEAYRNTTAVAQGKPVWVGETGWPVSGKTFGQAVPSIQNAQTYWDQVGCALFGNINTWWYTLQDAQPSTPNPSFGIVGSSLSNKPLFNLACNNQPTSTTKTSTVTVTSQKQTSTQQQTDTQKETSTSQQKQTSTSQQKQTSSSTLQQKPTSTTTQKQTTLTTTTTTQKQTTITTTTTAVSPPPTTLKTSTTSVAPPPPPPPPPPTSSVAPAKSCPTVLSAGPFEFPHLIVPVDSTKPNTAFGTSFDATFSPTVSTLFNFDFPASSAGKQCSLVFLLPDQSQLHTSSYTISGAGGLDFLLLSSPALQSTTYNTVPAVKRDLGTIPSVTPGHNYVVATGACPAGQRVGYEVKATGSLSLTYFQDFNEPGIGLFVTVCN